jgi:predicted patatin/cPLA2 family phospholipase
MSKLGLIVEGGGMKCAYSAGILDKFLDDNISFDYSIGVSAGAANTVSFLAHQRERNLRYYTKHIGDPNYLSIHSLLKTGSIFGLQYIYGDMTNSGGIDPLDFPKLMENPCEYELVVTNAKTGKPEYLSKQHFEQDNYWALMASCAIPIACKPIVHEDEVYVDGGVTDSIPIERAFSQGCDKVVVLLSKPVGFTMEPQKHKMLYHTLLRKYPRVSQAIDRRYLMYNNQMDLLHQLEKEGKAFVFQASRKIPISTYTKDPAVMQQLYDLSLEDYEQKKQAFFQFLDI